MTSPLPDPDRLEVLCFDLDDTILDNRSSMAEAWRAVGELVADAHPDVAAERVVETLGRSTRWFWSDPARTGRGRLDLPWARREILAHVLASLDRSDAALVGRAAALYTRIRDEGLRLHDGALEILGRCRARLPRLALVTNGATEVQRAKIVRFGLTEFFDHVQLEGEFGVGKPDRRVYENVLRVLDADPDRCLMVGDDYEADVLGALRAGLAAAWIDVVGRGAPPVEPPRPHTTLRSLAELAERMGL